MREPDAEKDTAPRRRGARGERQEVAADRPEVTGRQSPMAGRGRGTGHRQVNRPEGRVPTGQPDRVQRNVPPLPQEPIPEIVRCDEIYICCDRNVTL